MTSKKTPGLHRAILLLGSLAVLALGPHCAVPEYEYNPGLDFVPGQGGSADGTGGDQSGVGGDQTGSGGDQTGSGGSGTGGRGTGGSGTGGSGTGGSGTGGTGTGGDETGGAAGSDTGGAAGSDAGGVAGSDTGGAAGSEPGGAAGADAGGAAGSGGVLTCSGGYHICGDTCCRDWPADCSGGPYAADGSNPLIDDLEDGDETLHGAEDRVGVWYTFNDGTGTQIPAPGTTFAPVADGAEGTSYSAHTSGSGFTEWSPEMGFTFSGSTANACPYDASYYDGIRFCLKGVGNYIVSLGTTSVLDEEQGGTCTGVCNDRHGIVIPATADWVCHEVQWLDLRQRGWGDPVELDPSELVYFYVQPEDTGADFDVYVDEIRFFSASTTCEYPDGNLVNSTGWVGCEEALSSDDPVGLQGPFYAYGDEIACDPPDQNPCTSGSCCLDGATIVDNEQYDAWGCGIGLHLNATGGVPSIPSAYYGPVGCFNLELSGNSGGNPVRIGYTQFEDNADFVAPFVEITEVDGSWSGRVCFDEVTCPSWAGVSDCPLTGEYYSLEVQVAGGNSNSNFHLCLDSLVPDVPLDGNLGPWKFQNDLEGWQINEYGNPPVTDGSTLTWINTGTCAGLGCAEIMVPLATAGDYVHTRIDLAGPTDITGMLLHARVHIEAGQDAGVQIVVETGEADGWGWANSEWLSLAVNPTGWYDVVFDPADWNQSDGQIDFTVVERIGVYVQAGTSGGPYTTATVLVDSITLAVPATVDWGTGGAGGAGGATGVAGAAGAGAAGGA